MHITAIGALRRSAGLRRIPYRCLPFIGIATRSPGGTRYGSARLRHSTAFDVRLSSARYRSRRGTFRSDSTMRRASSAACPSICSSSSDSFVAQRLHGWRRVPTTPAPIVPALELASHFLEIGERYAVRNEPRRPMRRLLLRPAGALPDYGVHFTLPDFRARASAGCAVSRIRPAHNDRLRLRPVRSIREQIHVALFSARSSAATFCSRYFCCLGAGDRNVSSPCAEAMQARDLRRCRAMCRGDCFERLQQLEIALEVAGLKARLLAALSFGANVIDCAPSG